MAFAQSELSFLKKNCEKPAQQIDSRAVAHVACTSRTAENIDAVNDLALSQEGAPGTHNQIARETGMSQISVGRIIHKVSKSA